MTTVFQPPPTWALPVIIDPTTKEEVFNPIWLKWFVELSNNLGVTGTSTTTTTTVIEAATFGAPRTDPLALAISLGNAGQQLENRTFNPPSLDFKAQQALDGDAVLKSAILGPRQELAFQQTRGFGDSSSILATQIFGA